MAKYGFLGSSFDPITNGHLVSAQEMMVRVGLDKVFFMPSSTKRTDKNINAYDEHRLNMIKLAIEGNEKFDIEDCELKAQPWEIYTYFTMKHLKEKYPNDELYFMMGADLLAQLPEWKYGRELIAENKFIVIRRNNIDMHEVIASNKILRKYERNFILIYRGVDNNISSTYIREEFEMGNDPRYLMPEPVYHYIKKNGLYQSV